MSFGASGKITDEPRRVWDEKVTTLSRDRRGHRFSRWAVVSTCPFGTKTRRSPQRRQAQPMVTFLSCAQPRLPRLLVEEPASGHGRRQPVRALVGPVRELNAVPELARVPRLIQTCAKRIRGQPEHR